MDMTGWIEYFVEGLTTQLADVKERGEQAIRRDVLAKEHQLSDRQAKARLTGRLVLDGQAFPYGPTCHTPCLGKDVEDNLSQIRASDQLSFILLTISRQTMGSTSIRARNPS